MERMRAEFEGGGLLPVMEARFTEYTGKPARLSRRELLATYLGEGQGLTHESSRGWTL